MLRSGFLLFGSSITVLDHQQLVLVHNDCPQIFEGGDGHVGNQSVELVWRVFVFITFSGQPHMDLVWDIPDSFGPDGFVEPGADAHVRSSHLLHGKLPDFFECPRGMLLETHSMEALVTVDGILSSPPR